MHIWLPVLPLGQRPLLVVLLPGVAAAVVAERAAVALAAATLAEAALADIAAAYWSEQRVQQQLQQLLLWTVWPFQQLLLPVVVLQQLVQQVAAAVVYILLQCLNCLQPPSCHYCCHRPVWRAVQLEQLQHVLQLVPLQLQQLVPMLLTPGPACKRHAAKQLETIAGARDRLKCSLQSCICKGCRDLWPPSTSIPGMHGMTSATAEGQVAVVAVHEGSPWWWVTLLRCWVSQFDARMNPGLTHKVQRLPAESSPNSRDTAVRACS